MFRATASAFAILLLLAASASAGIVWDYSPATTGGSGTPNYSNNSGGQNFAETLILPADTWITGMSIYSSTSWGSPGGSVTIRIWSDSQGAPGSLLAGFTETISVVDTDGAVAGVNRKHADFTTPFLFNEDTTYWIGMSGTTSELAQMALSSSAPGDGRMAQFSGTSFSSLVGVGDMAFRLEGQAVPEPGTLALFGVGLAGLVAWRRRARRRTS